MIDFFLSGRVQAPAYLYDEEILDRQIVRLSHGKPENLEIFYAMKANSAMAILKKIHGEGFGIEIASGGELFLAQTAGVPAEKIIFTGPSKQDYELRQAVERGIKMIHVESVNEAERLQAICSENGKTQNILLRVNADFEVHAKVQLSGIPSPFGVSEGDLDEVLPQLLRYPNLELRGLHVYNSSGVLDYNHLLTNVRNVFELIRKIERQYAVLLPVIDFGGGLGIDYSGDNNVDVAAFYRGVQRLIDEYDAKERRLVMEIGRYLVAECGFYVAQITDKKFSRGKTFLVTDGGIHHQFRPKLFQPHPVSVIRRNERPGTETVTVTGVLCTNMDMLAEDVELPACGIGDFIVIEKSGAYGLNNACNHFLSHEMPVEIMFRGDTFRVIRERGRYQDLLLNQAY